MHGSLASGSSIAVVLLQVLLYELQVAIMCYKELQVMLCGAAASIFSIALQLAKDPRLQLEEHMCNCLQYHLCHTCACGKAASTDL
jgi:hypothetical protein